MAEELDQYGFRVGSERSKAAAIYSQGATRDDVIAQLGNPHMKVLSFVKLRGFTVKRERIRVPKRSAPHYRYTILPKEVGDG